MFIFMQVLYFFFVFIYVHEMNKLLGENIDIFMSV